MHGQKGCNKHTLLPGLWLRVWVHEHQFIYSLRKSYQGTRKIMPKKHERKEKNKQKTTQCIYTVNHNKPDILFLTTTLAILNWFLKKLYIDCSKIYRITLIVYAPYFVNLNNNTFKLRTLLFSVHLRSQQKRTEKVISTYQIYSAAISTLLFWE